MLPKLICKLLGHKNRIKAFTGQYDDKYKEVDPFGRPAAIYVWKYLDKCDRCGVPLH